MKIFDKKRITDKIEYKGFICYDYPIPNIDLKLILCYNNFTVFIKAGEKH